MDYSPATALAGCFIRSEMPCRALHFLDRIVASMSGTGSYRRAPRPNVNSYLCSQNKAVIADRTLLGSIGEEALCQVWLSSVLSQYPNGL